MLDRLRKSIGTQYQKTVGLLGFVVKETEKRMNSVEKNNEQKRSVGYTQSVF